MSTHDDETRMLRIIFLSHTLRESAFRVGSHHLSREFAARGHQVAHISTPVSLLHRVSRRLTPERKLAASRGPYVAADGVTDYTPRTLLPASVLWTGGQLRKALSSVGLPKFDIAFLDQPLLAHPLLSEGVYIFRPTDLFERRSSRARLPSIIRNVHGIAATSTGVASALPENALPSTVIENGVEASRFNTDPSDRSGFVYVGAVDFRFDLDAVIAIAEANAMLPVNIYGPVTIPIANTDSLPLNLTFHGPLPYEKLPLVLGSAKVGLLPFTDTPRNMTRSPMKLYEYLAAGLHVLAPAQPWATDHSLPGVSTYSPATGAGDASRRILANSAVANSRGVSIAMSQDWSRKADELLAFAQEHAVLLQKTSHM